MRDPSQIPFDWPVPAMAGAQALGEKKAPENRSLLLPQSTPRQFRARVLGFTVRLRRLAGRTLKWPESLLGKPVVEFADPL